MLEMLNRYDLLDYSFWLWVAAALFVVTVLRDVMQDRTWAGGR